MGAEPEKIDRLSSLDAFRGITIAGMILVNNPGSWQHVYAPLRHAQWHGWTPTDLIFPFFLFIVGVSISLSLTKRMEKTYSPSLLYAKIFRRSLILFALGIALRLLFEFDFANLRIPGVLQRIAICYLISALIFSKVGVRGRITITFIIITGYYLVMKFVPVPGYGAGVWEYQGNLCGYIDTKLLEGRLYKPQFDPEGILSTIPAIATTLLGSLTGDWLRSAKNVFKKSGGLLAGGILLTVFGLLLHPVFPINKQLWTSTYVLFTAGVALIFLGLCLGLMDGFGIKKWAFPFLVLGTNAIFVYAASTVMVKSLIEIKVLTGEGAVSLYAYIYSHLLAPWAGHLNGSLLFPLLLLAFWVLAMIPLYRKKIFIKI
jgi:predicted acyltransferase